MKDLEQIDVVDEILEELNKKGKAVDKEGVEYVKFNSNRSLLEIVKEGLKRKWSIEETLKKCNEWQQERIKAEVEVFGMAISRFLREEEVRNARVYILEKAKGKR